jgi:hypothetical protein
MKAETQIKYVVAQITPLADWFVRNQPGSNHRLHLRRADWHLLRNHPDLARAHGFRVEDERLTFKGFDIEPTDCGTAHNPNVLDTPR